MRKLKIPKKCYLVLEGGAVKGAALVGGVARLKKEGFEFLGYAGASSGAIVASLLAVGYTPEDLKKIMVEKNFSDFLDGFTPHADLRTILKDFPLGKSANLFKIGSHIIKHKLWKIAKKIITDKGLYDGKAFYSWIRKLLEKAEYVDQHNAVTFGSLKKANKVDLRIVAANLTRRKPELFGFKLSANTEVAHAVRASMAVPFYFKPHKVGEEHYFVDGGLVSNFPAWTFATESEKNGIPIIGLRMKRTLADSSIDAFPRYCLAIYNTVFESSNEIQSLPLKNMYPIVIDTEEYNSFDFGITEQDKEKLYWLGYNGVGKFLHGKAAD